MVQKKRFQSKVIDLLVLLGVENIKHFLTVLRAVFQGCDDFVGDAFESQMFPELLLANRKLLRFFNQKVLSYDLAELSSFLDPLKTLAFKPFNLVLL